MSIPNLYREVAAYGNLPPEYVEKQLHQIPNTQAVNRIDHLLISAKGKVVLDFGASGQMAEWLQNVASEYHGIDIVPNPAIKNHYQIDLDKADKLPRIPGLQLVIAGEVIEHLSNAGHFLDLLHTLSVPVILTTPNAHSTGGNDWLRRGIENVNREHVAWYSYHTLKVLIERHNFRLLEWFWYNGKPYFAEGLIFKMEPVNGK